MTLLVLNRNPFQCGEFLEGPLPVQPSDPGGFLATESNERVIIDRAVVDMDHAGLKLLGQFGAVFRVARVNGSTQTVGTVVGNSYRFLRRVEGYEAHRGPE